MAKWQERRTDEIERGVRGIQYAAQLLLAEAMAQAGATVHFSVSADNDDTLAAFAEADSAELLSADRDFTRWVWGTGARVNRCSDVHKGNHDFKQPAPGTLDTPIRYTSTTSWIPTGCWS